MGAHLHNAQPQFRAPVKQLNLLLVPVHTPYSSLASVPRAADLLDWMCTVRTHYVAHHAVLEGPVQDLILSMSCWQPSWPCSPSCMQ